MHGIALFSQAPSNAAGSCSAHAVQIVPLQRNQDRHKSSHPAYILQISGGVWLCIWVTNDFFPLALKQRWLELVL